MGVMGFLGILRRFILPYMMRIMFMLKLLGNWKVLGILLISFGGWVGKCRGQVGIGRRLRQV